jgi:hypothetical protein
MNVGLNLLRRGRSASYVATKNALELPAYSNVAALTAAGITAAANTRRMVFLTAGGTGSVACLAISDGTKWKQIAIGANCI